MQGFFGCYWRFDLGRGEGKRIPIEASVLRKTLGGVGLGSWLLHRECPVGIDPFDPRAPLVFAFSPLVGTGLTTSAKFAVVAKSPLTGRLCDALASSHFALSGKALGVDAIVLVGACEEPSELIGDSLCPSTHWGRTAEETTRSLSRFGRVATIGPAGETRVRFATLSAEGRHAGRGGLGAVMGSKNLKALVVDGREETTVAEPARVAAMADSLRSRAAGKATAKYRELGTTGNLLTFDRLGVLPTRNFRQSHFDGAERLAGEAWKTQRPQGRSSCAHCTIGCGHRFAFGKDETTRIEYESLFALGPLVGVNDPDLVLAAARRCDELGLDTISAGATLAFAMECGERGLLSGAPRFGEGESLPGWLDDIAERKGLGDLLADGSRRLAHRVGGGSIDFAPQVKGLEMPGYEPRSLQSMALGFAVGARGADHNRSSAYEADFSEQADRLRGDARSVQGAIESEDRAALMDSLILCKFVRGVFTDFFAESADLLVAVTGFDYDASELRRIARRIVTLRKGFNIREGWTPAEDTLPARFLTETLATGPASGARLPHARLDAMIEGYNLGRAWDASGWIPDELWRNATEGLGLDELEGPPAPGSAARTGKGRAG